MKHEITIMVSNLPCFDFLVSQMRLDPEKYKFTILYDTRRKDITDEVKAIGKGLANYEVRYVPTLQVFDIAKSEFGMKFRDERIYMEAGCIMRQLFMSVMPHFGIEKMLIHDEDIILQRDLSHFFESDYLIRGDSFLNYYPLHAATCKKVFDLEDEGRPLNCGQYVYKYHPEYAKFVEAYYNSDDSIEWYEMKHKNKGKFFYAEQGFTSYFMTAYLPSVGIEPDYFSSKDVKLVWNEHHNERIRNYALVHYPIKRKAEAIEKLKTGFLMANVAKFQKEDENAFVCPTHGKRLKPKNDKGRMYLMCKDKNCDYTVDEIPENVLEECRIVCIFS